MAKYFVPMWMAAVSGLLGNAVFSVKNRLLPVRGIAPAGIIREFTYAVATGAEVDNVKTGFTLLVADWKAMGGVDQLTWNDEAALRSATLGYDVTGRMLYLSYFLTKFTHGLSVYFRPATLAAGSGSDYASRATRQFTSAIT